MLVERLERDDVPVWLVNTGWTGGPYGVGERMNIAHTRSMVRAALDGALDDVPTRIDPNFGLAVPTGCPDVPASFLDPRSTWPDPAAYDRAAPTLASDVRRQLRGLRDGVDAGTSRRPGRAAADPARRLQRSFVPHGPQQGHRHRRRQRRRHDRAAHRRGRPRRRRPGGHRRGAAAGQGARPRRGRARSSVTTPGSPARTTTPIPPARTSSSSRPASLASRA